MANLQLAIKRRWFEMTKSGTKTEDYREITPFWCSRLLLINGKSKSKKWWFENFFEARSLQKTIISLKGNTVFKEFYQNIMTLGYPKSTDSDRILKFKHAGIEIRGGNPEWGAEPGKLYLVIKHGLKI